MAVAQSLSHVFPLGSRLDERGRLEVGGCDAIELAAEFGTPAYVVAEEDLRSRARAYQGAIRDAGQDDFQVTFAAKAFPCTAVMGLFAQEGLGCDVASAGELHLALRAGFDPAAIVVHGNARGEAELAGAVAAGVGLIVIDNMDDIDRLERLGAEQRVLIRVTPGVRGETHEKISTGQADSKFGLGPSDVTLAIERVRGVAGLELAGLHMHIGSQLFDVGPFRAAIAVLAGLGDFPVYDLGGGLGVAYRTAQRPPTVEEFVGGLIGAAHERLGRDRRLLIEPGRSLVANGVVTLYTVESVKHNVSTWVGVDGGMSDNLRPMLYNAEYEAEIADRFGGSTRCHVTGKHCESGDVIVRDAVLDEPRPGDILVTPATGAYGHAMANNYNGVPRPPVIFCKDGGARVVVRRETVEDLHVRDL
ncbi:MAG TPA: diaminopimelate decarboxylase [Solirubrobacteraceae bacterium]|jgi:diaminopimelate decarboxylase|nr:diaminopimelate decarboxylase [Solirubrobacteraceae bacterium]